MTVAKYFHCDIMPSAPTLKCRTTGQRRRDELRAASRNSIIQRRGSHPGPLLRRDSHVTDEPEALIRRSSVPDMVHRTLLKPKRKSEETTNGHVSAESETIPKTTSSLTPYKTGLIAFLAVVGTGIILNDFGCLSLEDIRSIFSSKKLNDSQTTARTVGGWRVADAETLKLYGTDLCNVDRIYVDEITPVRFESEYRLKKPLMLQFRNGAKDWTDPKKWTLESLKRKYGDWTLYSGNSLELVRQGGNGYIGSSFAEYVDSIMMEKSPSEEKPYVFDRGFYQETDLPKSLKLPSYLSVDNSKEESLFFLGSSGTGISFHNHADAWNAVIFGRKRWFLYNIDQNPPGGVYPGFTQLDWYHRIYPNLTTANKPMECVQEPGEILYLPEGVYHGTINLGDTVAVGIQKNEAVTEAMQHIYKENELREAGDLTILQRIELIHKVLDLYPSSAEMNMRLGALYEVTHQMEKAEKHCNRAIELDPYFIMAYLTLGEVQAELGKDKEAEMALKKVLDLNPNLWDVYAKYGMFLKNRGRYLEAAEVFRQGIQVDPTQVPFYYYLREVEKELGNTEAAKEAGEQLQRIKALREEKV